jgi:hypothetical protein
MVLKLYIKTPAYSMSCHMPHAVPEGKHEFPEPLASTLRERQAVGC